MTILEIKNLNHFYIKGKPVLNDIDIDLEEGEILSILGPSGCGKTTLLRIIAGLEKEKNGSIQINNTIVSDHFHTLPTEKRDVGLVVHEQLIQHLSSQWATCENDLKQSYCLFVYCHSFLFQAQQLFLIRLFYRILKDPRLIKFLPLQGQCQYR